MFKLWNTSLLPSSLSHCLWPIGNPMPPVRRYIYLRIYRGIYRIRSISWYIPSCTWARWGRKSHCLNETGSVQQRFIAIAKSAFGCWMGANPSSTKPPGCTWQLELIDPRAPFPSDSRSVSLTRSNAVELSHYICHRTGHRRSLKTFRFTIIFSTISWCPSVCQLRHCRNPPSRQRNWNIISMYEEPIYVYYYNRDYIKVKWVYSVSKTYETQRVFSHYFGHFGNRYIRKENKKWEEKRKKEKDSQSQNNWNIVALR